MTRRVFPAAGNLQKTRAKKIRAIEFSLTHGKTPAKPSAKTRKQTGTPRDNESHGSREDLPPTHLRPRAEAAERPARVIALVGGRPPVRPERVLGAARGRGACPGLAEGRRRAPNLL